MNKWSSNVIPWPIFFFYTTLPLENVYPSSISPRWRLPPPPYYATSLYIRNGFVQSLNIFNSHSLIPPLISPHIAWRYWLAIPPQYTTVYWFEILLRCCSLLESLLSKQQYSQKLNKVKRKIKFFTSYAQKLQSNYASIIPPSTSVTNKYYIK